MRVVYTTNTETFKRGQKYRNDENNSEQKGLQIQCC